MCIVPSDCSFYPDTEDNLSVCMYVTVMCVGKKACVCLEKALEIEAENECNQKTMCFVD